MPADELAARLRAEVGSRLSGYAAELEGAGLPPMSGSQRREVADRLLTEAWRAETSRRLFAGLPVWDAATEELATRAVMDGLFGLGGLQELLDDPTVENVFVNGCDTVFVRYADGREEQVPPVAGSDAELVELVRTVAVRAGEEERRFDRAVPRLNTQLADGSRMFAVMAVTGRVSVSIRRHRYRTVTLTDLVRLGVCDESLADFLGALVRARKNVIIAGGTNVGKTTVLRALASAIPPSERLVTIEDTFELGLDRDPAHPNVVAMQAREPNLEGVGAVDQAELVRWGLRMGPDRVIVGEIRGAEVVPMCNAMSQGNDGSMSTLHTSTSRGAFVKLAAYAAQSPERLSLEATSLLVASAVHVVVHIAWATDGRRVVSSVREVVDADGPQVVSNEVYKPGGDRRAVPATAPRAETMDDLVAAGLDPYVFHQSRWGGAP
ncbi:Flp pilus assembly complex ATPase component TadA [Yinghuangia sp. ASG 101]|uniref:CpaF family protein n=1 Tax=Yinghuangia sp. ASG 101 TaxID=2896848 RepID=UPI001E2FC8F1|nr:ATPase, T2SS/T4P/T4SS family [Yinghuangia sp. ASG 101]UGQ10518.1 Flp pilus assembly complex ATPase component TadA [Yinghuangia sp. ASG 101]